MSSDYVYDPSKPCPVDHRMVAVTAVMYGCDSTACGVCKLPIGVPCEPTPANDTLDALAELWAAEIAENGLILYTAEQDGFLAYDSDEEPPPIGTPWNALWQIGWLGRCISQHYANVEAT